MLFVACCLLVVGYCLVVVYCGLIFVAALIAGRFKVVVFVVVWCVLFCG